MRESAAGHAAAPLLPDLDDGSGLRVVNSRFESESKFTWELFRGFDRVRILTYSAGIGAIVRLLEEYGFDDFECVFGYEGTLRTLKDILAFQQVVIGDTRAALKDLPDERFAYVFGQIRAGQARFWVAKEAIAHAKIYLLGDSESGRTRVLIGSANLSEAAFGGRQAETLVCFEDDDRAWDHYLGMYERIRNRAADAIDLPPERIEQSSIELSHVPALDPGQTSTLVVDVPAAQPAPGEPRHYSVPAQIERTERIKQHIPPVVANILPAPRNGRQRMDVQLRRRIVKELSRIRVVKSDEEASHRTLSIDRDSESVELLGDPFPLEFDRQSAARDARALLEFFANYEGTFEGGLGVPRLQRDYFILWCWLYCSPFMCDFRSIAGHRGDIFRFPVFAFVYGKPSCGKSSLIDTLMTSMFGRAHTIEKRSFTRSRLRDIQYAYKRFPAVFDDIARSAIRSHGEDVIKDENPPAVHEYPCFLVSMNQDMKAFSDQIVKRSLMVYTTTALPSYKEELRHRLHLKVQAARRSLTTNLYRAYLRRMLQILADPPPEPDWLELSSTALSGLIEELTGGPTPAWCSPITWNEYAAKRHERVRAQLRHLLRPATRMRSEGAAPTGWVLEGPKVVVIEKTDSFGRREFEWDNVPSTLIDDSSSVGGRTVLNRRELEEFLEIPLGRPRGGLLRLFGRWRSSA